MTTDQAPWDATAQTVSPEQERNLRALLLAYWAAPADTQDEDDAFNALCEAISEAMTDEQRSAWETSNLKATQDEIVVGGLDCLHLETMQQEAWGEYRANHGCDPGAEPPESF